MNAGPRVLQCLDPVPASDGSCATEAWVEQAAWTDYLPTVDQAQAVGVSMFIAVMTIVAMSLLQPPKETES